MGLAKKKHIGFDLGHYPLILMSKAIPAERFIIINLDKHPWQEIPFVIGHEMAHVVYNDDIECTDPTGTHQNIACEARADKYSTNLIFDYAISLDDIGSSPLSFLFEYGVPAKNINEIIRRFELLEGTK